MAKGKWMGDLKDPEPAKPVEGTAGQGQLPPDIDSGSAEPATIDSPPDLAEQIERDMTPSCMNGCPHFFPIPEAQGKYMGLCRRFPPVPSATARYFAWPVFINNPVRGFPKYPICGEHPVFQHRKDFKPSQELQVK